ncbi:MAG: hypothetical protein Q9185_001281 [Variospora sp. 1 TL-2023]
MAYYRKIFKPLIRYMTRLQLSGRVRNPIQGRRYADPSAVFAHVLRLKLYNAYCVFQKRHDWWIAVFQGVIHENSNLMNFSTRSLPEILAESLLMSTIPTPSMQCRALPADHPDKERVKNELPMVKKQAILGLDMNILGPPTNAVLDEFRQRAIGLAYSGQTFALKPRCYACRLIYPFAWPQGAQHVVLNRDKDLETVAELDLNRIGAKCGCCGEALSFVQAMWHIKQGGALMHIYP